MEHIKTNTKKNILIFPGEIFSIEILWFEVRLNIILLKIVGNLKFGSIGSPVKVLVCRECVYFTTILPKIIFEIVFSNIIFM